MTLQILQYEFMGPVRLSEWGPPMEKTIYVIMHREKEKFHLIYAGDCKKTDKIDYMVKNEKFKCWLLNARNEENLYMAIRPMFDSDDMERGRIVNKIISEYNPICNQ